MKTICDRCSKYQVTQGSTREICHAFVDRQTRFTNEITKEYIEQRMIGEKNNCKEYKRL